MEIFIKIPFVKQQLYGNMWKTVKSDFTESIHYIKNKQPVIGQILLVICGINLFLSSMIIVGMPYLITEVFHFDISLANQLYGFTEGALAIGGLAGGISAGVFAKKLNIKKSGNILIACTASLFPIALSLLIFSNELMIYLIMTICCFSIMLFSTIFTIEMMSFAQSIIPQNLIGKIIAVILSISMCAQPLGNTLYGILFEVCKNNEYIVVLFAGIISLILALRTKNIFHYLTNEKSIA